MPETLFPQWRNQIEHVKYPFADEATLSNGSVVIPDELFIDLILHPIGATEDMYLSSVTVEEDGVLLTFSGPSGELCYGEFYHGDFPDVLLLEDEYDRPAGRALCTPAALAVLASWSLEEHLFDREHTAICPDAIIPTPELGVRGFRTEDGEVFYGSVAFVGEDGIFFDFEEVSQGSLTYQAIRVDAMGDPLYQRRGCVDEAGSSLGHSLVGDGPFLQTINSLGPDSFGNFEFFAGEELFDDTVIRIEPDQYGLLLRVIGTKK